MPRGGRPTLRGRACPCWQTVREVQMKYDILYCALCGKNYNDVNKLITEDGLTLCDVCYAFCAALEEREPKDVKPPVDRGDET